MSFSNLGNLGISIVPEMYKNEGQGRTGLMTEEIERPLEESQVGPTSIDVTDEPVSIGPTSIDVTDEQASTVETPPAEQQEKEVQELNKQIKQVQEESKVSKRKQERRITTYLSNISKQVEKNGNQISKLTMIIQSLQKHTKPISVGVGQSQFQSIKEIKTQISQLQKQVTQVQKEIQKLRTAIIARAKSKSKSKSKSRKLSTSAASTTKSRSKKSKSLKSNKSQRSRRAT
jgi:chromosome segregation ATPase